MFARQQGWLEVQTEVLQSKLAELSGHSPRDLKPFSTIDLGEVARQMQLQTQLSKQLEADQGRLEKIIRQKSLSLETAVSAQLMDFGTALRQRTASQLDMLRESTADLVKRQSERLKASLAAQLGCVDGDCLQQAQRDSSDDLTKQGWSPMSRSSSHIRSPSSPKASSFTP